MPADSTCPVEARLDPRALESEIADLIAGNDDDYVFHPSIGLVQDRAAREAQRGGPAATAALCRDGLELCPTGPLRRCGLSTSVEPETSPTSEEIFFDAQDDIGTEDLEQTAGPQFVRSSRLRRSPLLAVASVVGWATPCGDCSTG